MGKKKTAINGAIRDLGVLYAGVFGLSKAQEALVKEWLETYLPVEQEQIEQAFIHGADEWSTCGKAEHYSKGAQQYFISNYDL